MEAGDPAPVLAINPLLKPVSFLIGRWESKNGAGYFPSIKDFCFHDKMEFRQCGAQPLLAYSASSSHPEKGNPMHLESGFLRVRTGDGDVSFMVAHNFGLTTMEEGKVMGNMLEVKSTTIGRMTGAKDPSVTEVKRVWTLFDDSTLICKMWMATTTNKELTEHLLATYKREE